MGSSSGTGTKASGAASGGGLVVAPAFEPITLDELKLHLRLDSGSFADNIDETQLIPPGSHAHTATAVYTLLYELLTLDVAPGGAGWAAGDTLTGATSTKTCIIVEVLTTKTYTIKNRTGTFTLGEIIGNGTVNADQGAAYPTFAPAKVEVLGYTAAVLFDAGTFTTGTADMKIQESDDGVTWTDWTGGAFTQVSAAAANDNAIQEIAYTGTKRYVRTAAKVLVAACPFGTSVTRLTATSAEDDLLNAIITAAREHVEDITRRQIITATWDFFLQDWPDKDYIKLPYGNLQSVSSIKYKESDWLTSADDKTLALMTDYLVETNGEQCGRIVLPYGESWPNDTLYPSNPIIIRFVVGWTTKALVPGRIKSAIKLLCSDLYESRGEPVLGQTVSENKTAERLLASCRLWDEF